MPYIELYVQKFIAATPDLSIPLWQVLLFVVMISFAALYERYRFILISAYVFMSYWVFIENGQLFKLNFVWVTTGFVFLGIGLIAMLLTLYYMLTSRQ
ncbi:MAG: hypothetical protein R6V56_05055 [Lentisphaeria bacterium]